MRTIPLELFQTLVASSAIRPRIKRDVRFVNATSNQDWGISELIPVGDRSGNKGIIILEDDEANLYLAGYELSRGLTSSTGKAQPIICDFVEPGKPVVVQEVLRFIGLGVTRGY